MIMFFSEYQDPFRDVSAQEHSPRMSNIPSWVLSTHDCQIRKPCRTCMGDDSQNDD